MDELDDSSSVEDVIARCSIEAGGVYGIRMESDPPGRWVAVSAYRLPRSSMATRSADGPSVASTRRVSGSVMIGPAYRGCPYCKATGIAVCGCGEMACFGGSTGDLQTCPWCGSTGPIAGEITDFSVKGRGAASSQEEPLVDDLMETPWWED